MSTTLLYALVMAVAQIVVSLISFFLGYQSDKISSGGWFAFVQVAVTIAILIFGIIAVRDEREGNYLSYGKCVGTGFLIVLYSTVIVAIYTYIYLIYINPSFPDFFVGASRAKWIADGMTETKMETAEKGVRWLTKPPIWTAIGTAYNIVIGTVLSLIISAFLKRNPPEDGRISA